MPKKVLIIEDEEALLDMYSLRLEQEDLVVLAANRASEGIELAKSEQPDLILLDVVMPEMDGYQALEKLKSDEATKNLRVVFLSNLGQADEVHKGKDLGAEDYIIKSSLTPSSLAQKVLEKLGVGSNGKAKSKNSITSKKEKIKPSCQGLRVLMIEDNEVIIDMYTLRLEQEGAEVTVAKNGAWGVKQAEGGEYDVILMDMVMPALNGLETIKSLKSEKKTANIPILVFSNSAQEQDMLDAIAAGAEKYFIKSNITPATIVREVKKFCVLKKKK